MKEGERKRERERRIRDTNEREGEIRKTGT
jgi:hypothetical protein